MERALWGEKWWPEDVAADGFGLITDSCSSRLSRTSYLNVQS